MHSRCRCKFLVAVEPTQHPASTAEEERTQWQAISNTNAPPNKLPLFRNVSASWWTAEKDLRDTGQQRKRRDYFQKFRKCDVSSKLSFILEFLDEHTMFQKKPNFINFVLLKCCIKVCTGHLRPVWRAALLLSLQWHTVAWSQSYQRKNTLMTSMWNQKSPDGRSPTPTDCTESQKD